MQLPVYEYDQVLTCEELESAAIQLIELIKTIPFWKPIKKWKYKVALQIVDDLHIALHEKTKKMEAIRKMEDPNEKDS